MNDDSVLGNVVGQLGSVIKQTAQQALKIPADVVEGAGEQVGVKTEPSSQDTKANRTQNDSNKDTKELVEGLYAKSDNTQQKTSDQDNAGLKGQTEFQKMIAGKSPEDQKKLLQLHQQLHKQTYYDPTFNPPKKTEEQEERPAEKVEKEKMQDLQEEKKKEAQKPPPLVQRARERVEKFPGASG